MNTLQPIFTLDSAWRYTLLKLLKIQAGSPNHATTRPRGMDTWEMRHHTIFFDPRWCVLTNPARKLNYRFMAAEAHWILSGSDAVADIEPYCKNISKFSDDGQTFFGAYGPKVAEQLPYVIDKLHQDRHTRQAAMTIWRERPPETLDVPCTLALVFQLRKGELLTHVFMRSSDVWLGLPYDAFNFTMIAHAVCSNLNALDNTARFVLGDVAITSASSHLYERDLDKAKTCVPYAHFDRHQLPPANFCFSWPFLMDYLDRLKNTSPGDSFRWWEVKE